MCANYAMLFMSFGHAADEDSACLDLLTSLTVPPQGGGPSLREARDTKLLSSGTQLFPRRAALLQAQLNQLIIEAASRETISLCIFMNYPQLPGRVG